MGIPDFGSVSTDYFEGLHKVIANFKKSILMVSGAALQKFMNNIQEQRRILWILGHFRFLPLKYHQSTVFPIQGDSSVIPDNILLTKLVSTADTE